MKTGFVVVGLTCVAGIHAQAQVDKAEQYRGMLLKRPENAVLFGRMVDAWLEKGEMAGLKERLETAAAAGNAMDWRLLAVFRNFTGDEEGAIKALDEALKSNPDDPQSRLARAKSLGAASRFEDAIADLAIAAKDPASAMEAGTLKGKYLARSGRPAEAVAAWKEIIAAHPEDEGLQEDLIELEIGEGMLDEAVAAARELAAKTADPYQKALRQMHAAEILAQSGKKNEAVEDYKKVFAVSAESSWLEREVLARVNALFTREDDTAGLREFYQTMRDAYPRRVVVKKEAARSLLASGDGDEAVAMFREVLKVLPGDREARDEFIALLTSASRFKEAGEEVMSLLATNGQDAALWLKLAEIRKQANDPQGVTEAVDKAVALVPQGEAGKVAAAGIYERFARNDDALRVLREATKEHGILGEAGDALAVMLAAKGNAEEALNLWKEMAKTADREGLLKIVRSLTANGRAADAFGILQSRLDDFQGDPLLLAALCQTAQFADQSESAIPQALELVRLAKTTGDLETALRQASALITRAKEPSQWVAKLAGKADASPQELCLLAELHETLGDSLEADAVLNKAITSADPLMVAAQRVRLFEIRGDFDAAITATREWIALPGGMRTEQVKRLVSLHERTENIPAAIEETANWKRIAPGDKSAWTKRAELLLTDGKPEESVAELRRAIAKFGGDEEMKSKLADALAEAGLFEESWTMFNGLYDEAESPSSKIKWALSLAKLAAREGKEEELVNDFRRRARDNPSSTVPLLALAEMFREWQRPEDEIAVVEEASRRKPEDVSLLLRLADIEEGNGSLEKAEAMIRKAVSAEDIPENRRRLSGFWIRNGDAERGLAEMLAARGPAASPRETERLVMPLVDAKDWTNALRILTPEVARHPGDWRLGYLHAIVLLEHGSKNEALNRFNALLAAKDELQGVTPLIPANQMSWFMQQGGEVGEFQMLAYFRTLTENAGGRQNMYFGMAQTGTPVPGTLAELRPMALCRALSIAASAEDPAERAKKLALIQSPEISYLAFIKDVYSLKTDELRAKLLADGTDPKYYQWYLQTGNFSNERRGRNAPDDLKIWKKGADAALATDPKLALQFMARLPLDGESGVGAEGAKRMVEMIEKMTAEERSDHAALLHGLVHADSKLIPDELRRRAETILLTEFRKADMKQGSWFADGLAIRWLQEGRFDEALALINETEAINRKARASGGINPMSPYLMAYGWQGGGGLENLKFPEILHTAVSHQYRVEFASMLGEDVERTSENAKQLLKILGSSNKDIKTPELKPIDPQGLLKILPQIADPALRLFLAHSVKDPKVLAQTVSELEKSQRDQANVLILIAAYRISVDNDELAAYNLLVEAAKFSKSGGRSNLDGHLLQIGARLAQKTPAGFDIEPARRAALRLRKTMAVEEETKQQLASFMVQLGLEEQSKRYTAAPKAISSGRSPFGMRMGGRSNQSAADRLAVTALMTEGKREAAARRLVSILRKARAASSSGSNYEERQVFEMINSLKLTDEVADILKPSGDAGFNSKKSYALTLM
ncbi:MAG: tetratricopeptide repeat protein, partial [Akkermansiaceae bacterium]|nr:tetratricopeptide repeat protein [Akkermansiaceae bacterium]